MIGKAKAHRGDAEKIGNRGKQKPVKHGGREEAEEIGTNKKLTAD